MLAVFLVLWIILNGRLTVEIVCVGLFVSALVDLFCLRVLGVRRHPAAPGWPALALGLAKYLCYLLREVFRCNLAVIRLILSPRLTVEPELHVFRTRLATDAGRVALANSITLTPGTITCTLEGDELCVHALDSTTGAGVDASGFEARLLELEALAK